MISHIHDTTHMSHTYMMSHMSHTYMIFYTQRNVMLVSYVRDDFDVFVKQNVVSYVSCLSKRISKMTPNTTHIHHIMTYMLWTLTL